MQKWRIWLREESSCIPWYIFGINCSLALFVVWWFFGIIGTVALPCFFFKEMCLLVFESFILYSIYLICSWTSLLFFIFSTLAMLKQLFQLQQWMLTVFAGSLPFCSSIRAPFWWKELQRIVLTRFQSLEIDHQDVRVATDHTTAVVPSHLLLISDPKWLRRYVLGFGG